MTTPADPGNGRAVSRASRAQLTSRQPAQPTSAPAGTGLAWVSAPALYTPPELPDDRVMTGLVRNTTASELRIDATAARLVDATGAVLQSTALFARGFTHGVYPANQPFAEPEPEPLRRRIGKLGVIAPGATAPLTLSWRNGSAVRVEFGSIELPLP